MKKLSLSVPIVILNGCSVASGFAASHQSTARQKTIRSRSDRGRCGGLAMAAPIPIGPFCPFRSTAAIELKERERVQEQQQQQVTDANPGSAAGAAAATKPGVAEAFAGIQSRMQLGLSPDPETLRRVAGEMETAVDRWDRLFVERPLSTPDFGAREHAAMAETHLNRHGTSARVIALLVRWQSGCLRALADNKPAPVPPPGLDLNSMMEEARRGALASSSSSSSSSSPRDDKTPSITAMQGAERVTAMPFDPETLGFSETAARDEYHRLVEDHRSLIEAGSGYGGWDAAEQLAFLDRIEAIEDRWDSFAARFFEEPQVAGALRRDYVDQCANYLSRMKLTSDEYRQLLRDTHQRMRRDAEAERER